MADIESDGPFSSFPDVTRWFVVLAGGGVELTFGNRTRHCLGVGSAPLRFAGSMAPNCRLLDDASVDLNLMLRDGEGEMRAVEPGTPWIAPFIVRGLFAAVSGTCRAEGRPVEVAARTLVWTDAALTPNATWEFVPDRPDDAVTGWWLGYNPVANPI